MDGKPFDPPASTRGYSELRELAPVMFGCAADLAADYPAELGEFPHILQITWIIAQTLPRERANLIPTKEVPGRAEIGNIMHLALWKGALKPKYGTKTTFKWEGDVLRELESGLAFIAMQGTTPEWRKAATAAYDLLLRIFAALFNEFEIA